MTRHGKKPNPTIKGAIGRLTGAATVKYPDGVVLRFDRLRHGLEQGAGPGAFPGRAQTAFTITILNGSSGTVDMTQVAVTATYGSPARTATAVYDDPGVRDFGTRVAPKGTASATYAFAIPRESRGAVRLIVDFDSRHAAADFRGAAR